MINLYKQKLTNLQQDILRLMFIRVGDELNARQIANRLEVSQPAVSKALPFIEELNLIKLNKDKETKRFSITLNRENHKVIQLKRVDNLKLLYESGFVDYIEKEFAGATIILFGSYSKGEDTEKSDLDLAIIGRKEKHINTENYEKIFDRKIYINFYNSLKEIHKNLRENILNGIVLKGGVEL